MKKVVIICLTVLLLFASCITLAATKEPLEAPAKVKVISQSCTSSTLYITVIDLSNNEIVILCYAYMTLQAVIRTGMFVDPNSQNSVNGQDAPFEAKQK